MSVATLTPPPKSAKVSSCSGPTRWVWTRETYYKAGELGLFVNRRVQLINGEVIEMSPINWPHSIATTNTCDALRDILPADNWLQSQQPFQVGVSEPIPDVAVIPGAKTGYNDHPDRAALLVEVADSSLDYDLTTKAQLYATAGVTEYWVLDLDGRRLIAFRDPEPLPAGLGATAYRTRTEYAEADSVSPLFAPAAGVTVADLLPQVKR